MFIYYLLLSFFASLIFITTFFLFKKYSLKLWLFFIPKKRKKSNDFDLKKYENNLDRNELHQLIDKLKAGKPIKIPYAAFDYIYRHLDEIGIINKNGEIVLTKRDTYEKLLETLQKNNKENIFNEQDIVENKKPGRYLSIVQLQDKTFIKKENISSYVSHEFENPSPKIIEQCSALEERESNYSYTKPKASNDSVNNKKEIQKILKEQIKNEIKKSLSKPNQNDPQNLFNNDSLKSVNIHQDSSFHSSSDQRQVSSDIKQDSVSSGLEHKNKEKSFQDIIDAIDYHKAMSIFKALQHIQNTLSSENNLTLIEQVSKKKYFLELTSFIRSILNVFDKEESRLLENTLFKQKKSLSIDTIKVLTVLRQLQKVLQSKTPFAPFDCLKTESAINQCFQLLRFHDSVNNYSGVYIPLSNNFLQYLSSKQIYLKIQKVNDGNKQSLSQYSNINKTYIEHHFDKVE